tara:strand:+ start:787 stop:1662 length:876 start_codon:yes stop_codon:yes gene_type:complete
VIEIKEKLSFLKKNYHILNMLNLKNIFVISLISFVIFIALSIIFFYVIFKFSIIDNHLINKITSIESQIEGIKDEKLKQIQIDKSKNSNTTQKSNLYGVEDKNIIEILKTGGYVIFIRHADRDFSINSVTLNILDHAPLRDIPLSEISLKKGYCLSEMGIEESKMINKIIKEFKIPISKVIASNTCRTKETAQYIFDKIDYITNGLLPEGAIINQKYEESIKNEYKEVFNVFPNLGENIFIVGHSGTLKDIGINLLIDQSESIILKHDQTSGEYHYVANLKARDWFKYSPN